MPDIRIGFGCGFFSFRIIRYVYFLYNNISHCTTWLSGSHLCCMETEMGTQTGTKAGTGNDHFPKFEGGFGG